MLTYSLANGGVPDQIYTSFVESVPGKVATSAEGILRAVEPHGQLAPQGVPDLCNLTYIIHIDT